MERPTDRTGVPFAVGLVDQQREESASGQKCAEGEEDLSPLTPLVDGSTLLFGLVGFDVVDLLQVLPLVRELLSDDDHHHDAHEQKQSANSRLGHG